MLQGGGFNTFGFLSMLIAGFNLMNIVSNNINNRNNNNNNNKNENNDNNNQINEANNKGDITNNNMIIMPSVPGRSIKEGARWSLYYLPISLTLNRCLTCTSYTPSLLQKWAILGLFSFICSLFKQTIQFLQQINVKNWLKIEQNIPWILFGNLQTFQTDNHHEEKKEAIQWRKYLGEKRNFERHLDWP